MAQLADKALLKDLDLQFVFVSIDPARDTPERLKAYLANFDAPILGLTGNLDAAIALSRQHGAFFYYDNGEAGASLSDITASKQYDVNHTDRIFILNKQLQVVAALDHVDAIDSMHQQIIQSLE